MQGLTPLDDVPETKERAGLPGLELPNPYVIVLKTAQCERIVVPWEFAGHYCVH